MELKILPAKKVTPEEFIKELEGCIEKGTPEVDPMELKKMWVPRIERSGSNKKD